MRCRLLHSSLLVVVVLALVASSGDAQPPVRKGAPRDQALPGGAIMMPGVSPERDAMAVVEKLFDGMRAGDSAAVHSVFAPGALLGSVETKEGVSSLHKDADGIEGFVKAVGSPHQAMWDERIANPKIHVDADLAMVWVDYTFYAGDRKSHCGVDVFELVKGADGWKIVTLIDTRRRESCPDLPKR
jgi:putative lumazine-binding protein